MITVQATDAEPRRTRHHYQAIVDVHLLLMRDRPSSSGGAAPRAPRGMPDGGARLPGMPQSSGGMQVLLGRRANTGYGDGAYEPPSSRLTERETLVEAAIRVAASQAGITLDPSHVSLAHVMHDVSGAGRIAFFLSAVGWAGEPSAAVRSASYSDLAWFDLDGLPATMIDRARVALRSWAAGLGFSTYPACALLSDRPGMGDCRRSRQPARPAGGSRGRAAARYGTTLQECCSSRPTGR
jgi:8-oxo-dGTP diphosphatase